MGTTNTTSGSNQSNLQFNPISQGIYNQLTQGGGNVLGGYINNPFGNAAYTMGAAQSQKGAQQAGANNMGALQQNMLTSGLGGQAGAGFKQAQLAQTGRANQAMSSQANVQNVMQALQRQMSAAGTGLSYSPQLTGQSGSFNQQSSMGGLGTWLPQLLGAGLSAATGGMSSLGGGMAGAMQPSYMPGGGGSSAPLGGGLNLGGMAGVNSGMLNQVMQGAGGQAPVYNPYFASQMGGVP